MPHPADPAADAARLAAVQLDGKRFAHPDWLQIREHLSALDPARQHTRCCDFARAWALTLAREFGGNVYESANFLAVLPGDASRATRTIKFFEDRLRALSEMLGDCAMQERLGKLVMLVPPTREIFFEYYSDFTADGVHIQPGGVYLNRGYSHVLFPSYEEASSSAVVVHEMCHFLLTHRDLPLWLNEGVTQLCEFTLSPNYGRTDQPGRTMARYWRPERIAAFWSGRSFNVPGDASRCSYELAAALARHLHGINRRGISELLELASSEDSAFAAMEEVYGFTPAALLEELLGPGDWSQGHRFS